MKSRVLSPIRTQILFCIFLSTDQIFNGLNCTILLSFAVFVNDGGQYFTVSFVLILHDEKTPM